MPPLFPRPMQDCGPRLAYAAAAALGAGYALWLLPADFLLGHGAYFEKGDAVGHVSGWLFFRADAWHWPLLRTLRLDYPEGTTIALTDSIPLMALLWKPFVAWLPDGFHYFGLWHALAYLGQALAAAFAVRCAGSRTLAAALGAAAYGATSPLVLARLGHSALMMHAALLVSLGLYFAARRRPERARRALLGLLAATAVALLIHPYLMAMSFGLLLACLVDRRRDGAPWLELGLELALCVVALLGLALALGFSRSGASTTGYGFYSMNLASPFCGGRFLVCTAEATGGQYEGFAYLGLGALLLVAVAGAASLSQLPRALRRCPGLALYTVACTLYAVSNRVYLGSMLVLSFELPLRASLLAGVFRASGRFAWLPAYVALVSALAYLLSARRSRGWGAWLVALLLPVQWLDGAPLRDSVRAAVREPSGDRDGSLVALLSQARHLEFFPTYGCAAVSIDRYLELERLAARAGLTLNTAFTPRGFPTRCATKNRVFDEPLDAERVYAMPLAELAKNALGLRAGFERALADGSCVARRDLVLCRAGLDAAAWRARGLDVERVTAPSLDAPGELRFGADELVSEIGAPAAGLLVPTDPLRTGWLSLGPYLSLRPGAYVVHLDYVSTSPPEQQVGRWDVIGENSAGFVTLASGSLTGTAGAPTALAIPLQLGESLDALQLRSYFAGHGDLRVARVRIAPVGGSERSR